MRPNTRKILFYGFVLVFVVSATYMLAVAQGWVLDLKNLRFVKTGGIFVKFSPGDASLSINNKPVSGSRNFLSAGMFVSGLLPRDYKITLNKDGFYPWTRELKVSPGLISSASQVKLWPTLLNTSVVASSTEDFWITKAGLVRKDKNGRLLFNNNILKGGEVILTNEKSPFLVTLLSENYFLTNLEDTGNALNLTNLFNSLKQRQLLFPGEVPIKKIYFHPFSGSKILIITDISLYSLDLKKVQLERLLTVEDSITDSSLANSDVVILNPEAIISYNLLLKKTSLYPIDTENTVRIGASSDGNKIILLTAAGDALDYDRSLDKSDFISKNIKDFYFSPDKKRAVLIVKDGSFKVYYFENYAKDNEYLARSLIELPIKVEKKHYFYWLPGTNYGLLKSNDSIYAVELDTGFSQIQNYYKLASSVVKFVFNKKLYLLKSNGNLVEADLGI